MVAVAAPNIGVVNEGDSKFANVPVTVGKVNATAVVVLPTNDILPAVVTVVRLPNVKVALVVGAVSVILFIVVALATPNVGVVNVGAVNVLFIKVSLPPKVASVPVAVGKFNVTAALPTLPINDILPLVVTVD